MALGFAAVAALSIDGLQPKDDSGNGLRATRGDARGHVVEGTGTWLPRLGERWSRRFTETTMALSIVMLALSFIEFNPWMQSSSLAQTACGLSYSSASDRVGKTVCNYATVAFAQRMAVVSTALLVISGVISRALILPSDRASGRRWGGRPRRFRALPPRCMVVCRVRNRPVCPKRVCRMLVVPAKVL